MRAHFESLAVPSLLSRFLPHFLGVVALLAIGSAAVAQSDPPSRVGRLSELAGSVFLAPDEADTNWQPIGINYPVTVGDSIWVGQDGRAEIDFGAGQVRLSDESNVHFSQLDDRQFSAYLASGQAILHLRVLDPGETAKLDTANAQIDILRPGNYRIDASEDGLYTRLVVREGEAHLRVGDRAAMVLSGQTAVVDGNSYGASLVVRDGYGTDGFDAWSSDRDRRWGAGSLSSRYVSGYVAGVNDLDEYGVWETTPTYGAVWYPRAVATDWVPYRDGRWTHVQPWGWTWVDSAPWGWAPFHYGRWVRLGGRWGWCPGELESRPIYAPALVAWYGGPSGTSWSVGFSGPTFGWVPLAWGEPYWPHYRYGTDYWRQINRPYAVNVFRVPAKPLPGFRYSNARIPGAVTAVSGEVFTGRRPIAGNHFVIPVPAIAAAPVTTTPLAVRPVTRPRTADSLPQRIPAPAAALSGRGTAVRPEIRAPGATTGAPFTGRPGGTPGTISEPAPGVGRPAIGSPPTVGRPPAGDYAPGSTRPPMREPGAVAVDPRQSGGQVVTPSTRPAPEARQPIGEAPPTVGRPSVRQAAPYSPGLSPAPQTPMPPRTPAAPMMRERAPTTAPYNPAPQNVGPPPRPAAPAVRERAPMPPQYNPGLSPGQGYAPPPRPAAPVARESAPMPAPGAVPAPIQSRQAPDRPAPSPRATERPIETGPAIAPSGQ